MKYVAFNPITLNDPSKSYLFEDTAMPRDWKEGHIFGNVWDCREQKTLDFTFEVRKNNPHHYRFNLTEWARVIENCIVEKGTFSGNFIFVKRGIGWSLHLV